MANTREMEVVKKTMKMFAGIPKANTETGQLYAAYGIFGIAALYIFYNGQLATVGLAIGTALVLFTLMNNLAVALIGGALAGLLGLHYSRPREGFTTQEKAAKAPLKPKKARVAEIPKEPFETEETEEGFEETEELPRPLRKGKTDAPNNGERAEFFELGKKYKGPSEEDDSEFHLDAGTTFMNAYKSLKPEQIAAMTKDTQELMQTQRQLMSTLSTLKPLIQDGKQMMDMFQGYFGSGAASMN